MPEPAIHDTPQPKPAKRNRDHWRADVRDGKWPRFETEAEPSAALTFGAVCEQYKTRYVEKTADGRPRREHASENMGYQIAALRAAEVLSGNGRHVRLETKPIAAITRADVEAIREARRAQLVEAPAAAARVEAARAAVRAWRRTPATRKLPKPAPPDPTDLRLTRFARASKGGEVGTNRLLRRLRHLFTWAIGQGYVDASPFKRGGVPVITLNGSVEKARTRRLEGDEEQRLLAAASPHLQSLIVAALETGCRKGELTSMVWDQVHLDDDVIMLPAEKTKTGVGRVVPITKRLKAILEMRRTGPDGEDLPATAHVFGTEVGEQVKCIKTAWRATCRRAGIVG